MNQMMNFPYTNPFAQRQTQNGINWVQGIEGAKAYNLLPKENAVLMDSEVNDIFYIKICDDIGRCTLRKFRYQEEFDEPQPTALDLSDYVRKSELESLVNKMLGGGEDERTVQTAKSK